MKDPFWLELLSVACNRLAVLNEQRGGLRVRPEAILAALVMPDRKLYVAPAAKTDPRTIEIKTQDSKMVANLRKLLQPHGLSLEKGSRMRFSVDWAGPESPIGPALVIDLTQPLEVVRYRDDGGAGQKPETEAEPQPAASAEPAAGEEESQER